MKKIEPGCRAIVISSKIPENIGKEVVVECKMPDSISFWYIRTDALSVDGRIANGAQECNLMRIDDFDVGADVGELVTDIIKTASTT